MLHNKLPRDIYLASHTRNEIVEAHTNTNHRPRTPQKRPLLTKMKMLLVGISVRTDLVDSVLCAQTPRLSPSTKASGAHQHDQTIPDPTIMPMITSLLLQPLRWHLVVLPLMDKFAGWSTRLEGSHGFIGEEAPHAGR